MHRDPRFKTFKFLGEFHNRQLGPANHVQLACRNFGVLKVQTFEVYIVSRSHISHLSESWGISQEPVYLVPLTYVQFACRNLRVFRVKTFEPYIV